jgi:hypothetical protein
LKGDYVSMDEFLEVDFKTYCAKCKYRDKKEFEDPCNECMEVGMREQTRVPEKYVEAVVKTKKK